MINIKSTIEHKFTDGSIRHGTITIGDFEYDVCVSPAGVPFICRTDDTHDHNWVRQSMLDVGDWD